MRVSGFVAISTLTRRASRADLSQRERSKLFVTCTISMYNLPMKKTKEIPFSEARRKFSTIVDEVETTGKPVTILRHGKPAAVVISHLEYRRKFGQKGEWKLAGSLKFRKGVDIDKALKELSERQAEASKFSLERSIKEFQKD